MYRQFAFRGLISQWVLAITLLCFMLSIAPSPSSRRGGLSVKGPVMPFLLGTMGQEPVTIVSNAAPYRSRSSPSSSNSESLGSAEGSFPASSFGQPSAAGSPASSESVEPSSYPGSSAEPSSFPAPSAESFSGSSSPASSSGDGGSSGSPTSDPNSETTAEGSTAADASSTNEGDLLPGGQNSNSSFDGEQVPLMRTVVASCAQFTKLNQQAGINVEGTAFLMVSAADDLESMMSSNTATAVNGSTIVSFNGTISQTDGSSLEGAGVVAVFHRQFCSPDGGTGAAYRYQHRHGVANALVMQGSIEANGFVNISATRPFVVTFDEAKSVLLRLSGADSNRWGKIACCNLVPRFPTLPKEWSVIVEANIVHRRYSYFNREFFSGPLLKKRLEQEREGQRVVSIIDTNLNQNQRANVFQNRTCVRENVSEGMAPDLDSGPWALHSILDYFGLVDESSIKYVPNAEQVRGVDVERWDAQWTPGTDTYNVSFYFAADTWEVEQDQYHRDLRRIHLQKVVGPDGGQEPVEHFYEFIHMRPRIDGDKNEIFDPCAVYRNISGCGCGGDDGSTSASANMEGGNHGNGSPSHTATGFSSISACKRGVPTTTVVGISVGLVIITGAVASIGWYIYMKSRPDAWAFRFSQKERSWFRRR